MTHPENLCDVSVVLPIYNEEAILHAAIVDLRERLKPLGWAYEIILAENGSRDATVSVAAELADPKSLLARYRAYLDSPGAFFQAQLVLYGRLAGCEIVEIPVTLSKEGDERRSRFALVGDGLAFLGALVRETRKLSRARTSGGTTRG